MKINSKVPAFTLAEVLITLGIIGVVAAMTIPTLITKSQKDIWTNQLKKTYTTISQSLITMAEEETNPARQFLGVSLSQNCPESYANCTISSAKLDCEFLSKYFVGTCKVFNADYNISYLNKKRSRVEKINSIFQFNSGAEIVSSNTYTSKSIYRYKKNGTVTLAIGPFYIDVNGHKSPPNTFGRDIFAYYIDEDKYALLPCGTSKLWYDWKTTSDYRGTCDPLKPDSHYGVGCAARIIEEGWKMNY